MNRKGKLIILSGPSGVGKGTVRMALMKNPNLHLFYSVSMTTRSPRPGEVNGREYYFVSKEEFQRNIDSGNLLEWAEFVGNQYGTPKDKVDAMFESGQHVLKKCPDAISIYLMPPAFEALEARIRGRSTESEDVIQMRLAKARKEMTMQDHYAYKVYNDDIEKAAEKIAKIIEEA